MAGEVESHGGSRWARLAHGFNARRDAELDRSQAAVADASVAALTSQKAYEQLRAPFAGTVTARFADPGALVQSAVSAQTGALPVVTISAVDRLRVFAYVDQRAASLIHVGAKAEVSLPGSVAGVLGGEVKKGQVARFSHELDPRTRTMLVEIELDNKDGRIIPGSFVNVAFAIKAPPAVEVPVEALVLRERKPFVATIKSLGEPRVSFREVVLAGSSGFGSDSGHIRVTSGLAVGQLVALNLGESMSEGSLIQPVMRQVSTPARSGNAK